MTGTREALLSAFLKRIPGLDAHGTEVLRGAWGAVWARVLAVACGYAFALAVSRFYGAEGMGLYGLAAAVLALAALPASLGLGVAVLRFIPELLAQSGGAAIRRLYRNVLRLAVPSALVFGAALFAWARPIAERAFGDPALAGALRLTAGMFPFFALGMIHIEAVRGFKNVGLSEALRGACIPLVALCVLLTARRFAHGARLTLWSYGAGVLVLFFLAVVSVVLHLRRLPAGDPATSPYGLRDMLRISAPMMWGELATVLMGRIDLVMLGLLADTRQVGVYALVFKLGVLPGFLPAALATIAAPKFAELFWSGRRDELSRLVRLASGLMFWTSVPVFVCLAAAPRFWLGLFGNEFRAGAWALILVGLGQIATAASGYVGAFLNMTGRQKAYRNIIVASVVGNVLLNGLLIPRYGVSGAAAASAVTTLFWNAAGVLCVWRAFGIRTLYLPFMRR